MMIRIIIMKIYKIYATMGVPFFMRVCVGYNRGNDIHLAHKLSQFTTQIPPEDSHNSWVYSGALSRGLQVPEILPPQIPQSSTIYSQPTEIVATALKLHAVKSVHPRTSSSFNKSHPTISNTISSSFLRSIGG